MVEVEQGEKIEFKWGKKRGVGGKKKEVQFYESFSFDGVEYTLYDSVYLYKESEPEPFIGKLIKIWQNPDKSKRVKILWFFRSCEIQYYLGAEEVPENELFLASGEGLGLANVNPLEAIVGKCNVICISKDERNPQPSDEELNMAEFVFYRTFDVGRLKISDKIDDKIAGIEAKHILNNVGSRKFDGNVKSNSTTKEDNGDDSQTGVSDKCAIRSRLIKSDERIDGKQNERGEDGLKIGDANFESSLIKDISLSEQISPRIKDDVDGGKGNFGVKVDKKPEIEQGRPLQDPGDDERPLKKAKLDVSINKLSKEEGKNNVKVSMTKSSDKEKARGMLAKQKNKTKNPIELVEIDVRPSIKTSRENSKLPNAKLTKTSSSDTLIEEDNMDYQTKEVTRRPDIENKSKWFTKLPWEERMEDAQKKGMLVLLRNLDPSYTSMEVEDIVWHGLKLYCTAKMIQHTAISSPHSGEAFLIFKTREAAETALKKLDKGCLMLPNGRPLVGCIGDPSFAGNQPNFPGHLVFTSSRHPLNREKEAVSTSHCSQSNTIEYEMAIDWCLLQERWDRVWQLLYKQQGKELRKLQGSFKSK